MCAPWCWDSVGRYAQELVFLILLWFHENWVYSLVRIVVIVWSLGEMDHWSVQHHSVAVEMFIKTESITATQRGFRQQFQDRMLRRSTLLVWVSNWHQEGSVKDYKAQELPRSGRTPDNVERVRNVILRSPHRSAQRHAVARRWTLSRRTTYIYVAQWDL